MGSTFLQRSVATLAVLSSAVTSAATVDLPIIIQNTYASVEAQIGTPPSTYRLLFDTGSASSWLQDASCSPDSCPNGSGYQRVGYNASASSTSTVQGPLGTIAYGDGSDYISGLATTDKFSIATCKPALTWKQTFLSITHNTWRFITADGFLGLAFSTIASENTTTLFETLMQKGLLDRPRFGIYYGKEFLNTGANPEGVLTLGGDREKKYVDGPLNWIPMRQEFEYQVWRAPLKAISGSHSGIGSNKTNTTVPVLSDGRVVFDTGSGGLFVPTEIIPEVYESIGFNWTAIITGAHKPLCTEFNSSWSVTFDFGDWNDAPGKHVVSMSGDQLARPGFAGSDEFCFPPFDNSGVVGYGNFGTPFLHQFYSVWDFGAKDVAKYAPRIGFGKLKKNWKP